MTHTAIDTQQSAWRSPWVLGWLALVATVLMANSFMVYLAMTGSPGLVVEDYYERGQHYEHSMVARMAKDPEWEMNISVPEEIPLNEPTLIAFSLATKEGNIVAPDRVVFHAYRPSDAKRDFWLPMYAVGDGQFQTKATFALKGVWDILVSVQKDGEEYNKALRITVAAGE